MLKNGIIQPSAGLWPAPMVLVQNKDSSLRLSAGYFRLNSVSKINAYPMC